MKKAFTLTEVLITLTVIGVIAAITMPVISANANRAASAEGCKKGFVVLSEALELAKLNQPLDNWSFESENTEDNYKRIKPFIRIQKECINTTGCWATTTKALSPNSSGLISYFSSNGITNGCAKTVSFVTTDGMYMSMANCKPFDYDTDTHERAKTIVFAVDTNGGKGPNRIGEDIFMYTLGKKELLPQGLTATNSNRRGNCSRSTGQGTDCTAVILKEGKINY